MTAPDLLPEIPLVIAHIRGAEKAAQFLRELSVTSPTGSELCNLLVIDQMKISDEQKSYLTGLCRALQKYIEQRNG